MKYSFVGVIIWGIVLLIGLAVIAGFITLLFFGIKALKKYLNTKEVREEKATCIHLHHYLSYPKLRVLYQR